MGQGSYGRIRGAFSHRCNPKKVEEKKGIRSVHDVNAAADDFSVNGLQAAKNDIVKHAESVLASPVPRRVVNTGLEGRELGLNT